MPGQIFTVCERAEQAISNVKAIAPAVHTAVRIIFPPLLSVRSHLCRSHRPVSHLEIYVATYPLSCIRLTHGGNRKVSDHKKRGEPCERGPSLRVAFQKRLLHRIED